MSSTLNQSDSRRVEHGFTLIELLVAMALVGILSAIAIPQYSYYREQGYDAMAQHSLRVVATAEEAYFIEYSVYKECDQDSCPTALEAVDPLPEEVLLQITTTADGFSGEARHTRGTGKIFSW